MDAGRVEDGTEDRFFLIKREGEIEIVNAERFVCWVYYKKRVGTILKLYRR